MGLTFVKRYPNYNPRRFGTPWIAIVNPKTGRLDFSKRVGGYSGLPGEQGDLYLFDPVEGCVYAYGQKDYSHPTPKRTYVLYTNGTLEEVKNTELLQVLKENTIVLQNRDITTKYHTEKDSFMQVCVGESYYNEEKIRWDTN